jgi:hypothetical protein
LILFFNFPLGTGSSTAAMTDSKCSLRASPCSLMTSVISDIGEEEKKRRLSGELEHLEVKGFCRVISS